MATEIIYVTRPLRNGARKILDRVGLVRGWDAERPVPHDLLLDEVEHAEALLCMGDDHIGRDVIDAGRRLRVISTASAGFNHIDLAAAAARGIAVCHTPGAANKAVADFTMALILACARKLVPAHIFTMQGAWEYWAPSLFEGIELSGSSLGIIGLGHIGIQVAHRAQGFGLRVRYHDAQRRLDAEERLGVEYGSLENVLREADFVSLHVPLLPATRGLINAARLRLMKPTAYLINVARGPVVEHDALVRALREGWITGVALDVYDQEPLPRTDPLLTLPNVLLTPHIGANTRRSIAVMMEMAAQQVAQVLQGHRPAHPVPMPAAWREAA